MTELFQNETHVLERIFPGFIESTCFVYASRLAKSKYFGVVIDTVVLVCVCVEFVEVSGKLF
jgi:hypothetical protein